MSVINLLRRIGKSRRGATAVEYGLIVSLIVIVMVTALIAVANTNSGIWNNVAAKVQAAR